MSLWTCVPTVCVPVYQHELVSQSRLNKNDVSVADVSLQL